MNLRALSLSTQVMLAAGLLLFIFLFFDWQQACAGPFCVGRSGWAGWGVPTGLFLIALLLWEVVLLLEIKIELPVASKLVTAGLAGAVLLFTLIKFLVDNEARHWPAWLGLILAIAVGVGGWLRFVGRDPVPLSAVRGQSPPRQPPSPPPS